MRWAVESGCVVRERGAGPAVVWVHGLGESGRCFDAIVAHPALAAWRHVVVDLAGYGRSAWPASHRGLVEHAERLAAWLRAREDAPVVVAGHSMGGVIALLLAERHPQLVRGVLDIEGNKSAGDCGYSSVAARYTVDAWVVEGFAALRDDVYQRGLTDSAHRGYFASMWMADPRVFHADSLDLVALSTSEQLAARLAALRVPRCYVPGVGAPGGAPDRSRALVAEAGVPVAPVGPSGHWPFVSAPDAFAQVAAGFFAEVCR
jgi:pimeloyl-ACP methyl ester carboxylesterase